MTIIEKIHMKGFKSFAKPIEIEFGNNFNCIIGPNGSGKSNVMDALTFVLGKTSAKQMRAERSSNLIFNGGKKGSSAKEAEVSILFSNKNKEFPLATNSAKITRIVKQSGNSIYKINDKPYTRQQIVDLLAKAKIDPEGHNIVLQGDITSLISMKPEERRIIIEDISGISLYEDKKQKALLELNKVEEKLNESNLILKERSVYLKELKKEKEQALKYKEVESKIKQNKATFLHLQKKEKEDLNNEIESKINTQNQTLKRINNTVEELQKEIEKNKKNLEEINKDIEEKSEVEQISLQKDLEELKEGIIKKTTRSDSIKTEIIRITQRVNQLNKDKEEIHKKIQLLNEQKSRLVTSKSKAEEEKLKKQIIDYKQHHKLADFSSIEKLEVEIEDAQNNIFKLKEEKNHINNLIERDNIELATINERLKKHLSDETKNDIQKLNKVEKEIDTFVNKYNITLSQIELNHENINNKKIELANLEATKIRISGSFQENQAVSAIINSKIPGIYGTISRLGKVDQKYSKALEVIAGPRVNSLVVDSDLTAQRGINLLKEKKVGTAIFLPLNKLKLRIIPKELEQLKNFSGVKDIALNLIKFDKKYEKAFSYVFGSTLVIDDITTARKVGIGRARMVTLDGDLAEISGAMIGGYRKKTLGIFEQNDIDKKIKEKEEEIENLKPNLTNLQKEKSNLDNKIKESKNEKTQLESRLAKVKIDDLRILKDGKSKLIEENKGYYKQLNIIEKNIKGIEKELEQLKQTRRPSKNAQMAQGVIEQLEKKQLEVHEKVIQNNTEIKNIEDQISTIHQPELDKIVEIKKQHNKELEEFKNELNELEKEIKEKRPLLSEKESKEKLFRENYKSLFVIRNKIQESIIKIESKINQEQFKTKEIEKRINEVSIQKAKITAEIVALQSEFEPYIGTALRRNISKDDLKQEIQETEKIMKTFGNINMKALEVYEVVEKEYEGLIKKTEALQKEKGAVLNMMEEIEGKKKRVFMRTYKKIAENFQRIFMQLSTKGDAYLDLEDKENPLKGGLNIKVRLAGTKFLDLHSLSGGEKSLTALAFIFSIQEYEPSSFYLLDEVDAALDKTNSQLLSKLIFNYSKNSQYIVISHNDNVITDADLLYGVSMQQNGISKIVSLKL